MAPPGFSPRAADGPRETRPHNQASLNIVALCPNTVSKHKTGRETSFPPYHSSITSSLIRQDLIRPPREACALAQTFSPLTGWRTNPAEPMATESSQDRAECGERCASLPSFTYAHSSKGRGWFRGRTILPSTTEQARLVPVWEMMVAEVPWLGSLRGTVHNESVAPKF